MKSLDTILISDLGKIFMTPGWERLNRKRRKFHHSDWTSKRGSAFTAPCRAAVRKELSVKWEKDIKIY